MPLYAQEVIAMLKSAAILLLIAGAVFAESPAPNAIALKAEVATDGDSPVLEYRQGGDLFKPYVSQFFLPAGVNVLRDQVADHQHHHGLMFAVGVDGVDFWAETPKCGRQIFKAYSFSKGFPADLPWAAVMANELAWVSPQGGAELAREQRTITAYRRQGLGASLLTWQTQLRPAEGKASIKLSGSHYFGLGMRFVQSMDGADDFFTPAGKSKTRLGEAAGETVRGNERLVRGKWCAYAAEVDGKPVTVAMFDHPKNVRPAWWFIMAKPFAYMSATLNLHREPLVVEAGKPLTLTYGVAVWDGKVKPDEIEKLYVRWLELAKPALAGPKNP
jgi:hypothetical protein